MCIRGFSDDALYKSTFDITLHYNGARAEAYLRTEWHLDPSSSLATINMGQKVGAVPLFRWAAGSPSNAMWSAPRPTSVPSGILIHPGIWPQQTWAENWGLCPLFLKGELDPHVTQCGRDEAYLRTKSHFDPSSSLATINMGQKVGGYAPF